MKIIGSFMNAEEAKEFGLIDEVMKKRSLSVLPLSA